jgi:hypothetical protein
MMIPYTGRTAILPATQRSTSHTLNPIAAVFQQEESDADECASVSSPSGAEDDSDIETVTEES